MPRRTSGEAPATTPANIAEEMVIAAPTPESTDRPGIVEALSRAVDERVLAEPDLSPDRLVAVCEHLSGARWEDGRIVLGQRPAGVVYTPPILAARLVEISLEGSPRPARVIDPACGGGTFLLAALRWLLDAPHDDAPGPAATPAASALRALRGFDVDPLAVHVARTVLRLELRGRGEDVDSADLERAVEVADTLTLTAADLGCVDVVVGNPPFRSPLRGGTVAPERPEVWEDALGAYADLAANFLAWAHHHVRPDGGRVVLVQPASVLAGRDTAGLRSLIDSRSELAGLWLDTGNAFDAAVNTTAPLVVRGRRHDRVRLWRGTDVEEVRPDRDRSPRRPLTWADHAATAIGLPDAAPTRVGVGTIGDIATATADFRDQYYGMVGHVVDVDAGHSPDDLPEGFAPIITSGLIDPAHNAWGRRQVRLHRRGWLNPALDLAAVAEGELAGWVEARTVPKVLVATQTRVVEAVVDETGAWLPSVPVITVVTEPERLWHVAAALSSPTLTLLALRRGIGTARSLGALKLSATSVAELPIPLHEDAWDEGVAHLRSASEAAGSGDAEGWTGAMVLFAAAMASAYAVPAGDADELGGWWLARLPDPFR